MSRSRKRARSKAQKKLEQESVNENNTNLETSSIKKSPSDVNTTVDTLVQTDSTNLLLFPEHKYRDNVPTTATISCQNALLEVESAAKLPSAKPMELDLNPIENHLENNVAGKKKRKRKKNKRSCTAALTNPQISLHNAESAVQLPAQEPLQVTLPNAESAVKLPTEELQGLNMNLADNLEVASVNRKQKKRKKKNLNKPTSNVLELDSTELLAPKHQERDTNLTEIEEMSESGQKSENGKKKRKKRNLNKPESNVTHVESTAEVPVPEHQERDTNLTEVDEKSESGQKSANGKKKRKKEKLNKLASNVIHVESTAEVLVAEHQERDTNLTEVEEKSESGQKSANGKKKRKKEKLNKLASNVIHAESTAEVLVPEHQERDTNLTEVEEKSESGQKSANGKKKRKKEKLNKLASNVIHAESTAEVLVAEHQERDTNLTEVEETSESGQKSANGKKKRKKKNLNKPASNVIPVESTAEVLVPEHQERDTSNVIHVESTAEVLAPKHQERDTKLTEIEEKSESGQKSANGKKKRKKKNRNKPASNVIHVESTAEVLVPEHQEGDTSNVIHVESTAEVLAPKHQERDTNLTEIEEKSESGQKSAEGKKKRRKKKNLNKPASNVIHVESTAEVLVPEHQERDTSSPNDLEEKTANGRKRKRGENIVKPTSDDQHVELTAQLPPNNQELKKKRKRRKAKEAANNKIDNVKTETLDSLSSEREGTEALCAGFAKLSPEDVNFVSVQTEHIPNAKETKINCENLENESYLAFPEKDSVESCSERTHLPSSAEVTMHVETKINCENLENGSYSAFPEKNSVESCSERTHLPSSAEVTMHVETKINCENLENGSYLAFPEKNSVESCSERTHLPSSAEVTMHVDTHLRRKLLILDLNGLLADIVMPAPKGHIADAKLYGRAVFKRPFCDDFLKFCFERFNVAIWSSRSKRIIDRVVDYLLGDLKHKLLFCWDMSHTTMTTFKTLENKQKPLVCKDLRKIWDKHYPDLPWEKGDYDESNTLLLDDSPYKALLNPVHTTVFPHSYTFNDKKDNSLGPGGDLRVYLEKLANAEHVQKYVEEHPFGKNAISYKSANWAFYSRVLKSLHDQAKANCGDSAESTLLEQGLHVHPGNTMIQLMQ